MARFTIKKRKPVHGIMVIDMINDIIDIWLDLRDNKNELSFAKNDKRYGKAADVKILQIINWR